MAGTAGPRRRQEPPDLRQAGPRRFPASGREGRPGSSVASAGRDTALPGLPAPQGAAADPARPGETRQAPPREGAIPSR